MPRSASQKKGSRTTLRARGNAGAKEARRSCIHAMTRPLRNQGRGNHPADGSLEDLMTRGRGGRGISRRRSPVGVLAQISLSARRGLAGPEPMEWSRRDQVRVKASVPGLSRMANNGWRRADNLLVQNFVCKLEVSSGLGSRTRRRGPRRRAEIRSSILIHPHPKAAPSFSLCAYLFV